jgi:ATP-dependent RNA helicase MSS116
MNYQYGAPYSADLYLHRLGRTGRAGKEGAGLQVLLPFESALQKTFIKKNVPQREASLSLDKSDQQRLEKGKHLIGSRHATLTPKAEAAYLSMVAYYQEYARRNISANDIMDAANKFCQSVGLVHVPSLPEELANQLRKYRK